MVLLHDIVEVLRTAHLDAQATVGLKAHDGCGVGAALVDGDLPGHAVRIDGALEENPRRGVITLCTQQEVDRVAVAVDCSVQVLLLAADLDVGLSHSPARADWPLALTKRRREHRHHLDRPAMQGGVVDEDARARPSSPRSGESSAGKPRTNERTPTSPPAGSASAEPLDAALRSSSNGQTSPADPNSPRLSRQNPISWPHSIRSYAAAS